MVTFRKMGQNGQSSWLSLIANDRTNLASNLSLACCSLLREKNFHRFSRDGVRGKVTNFSQCQKLKEKAEHLVTSKQARSTRPVSRALLLFCESWAVVLRLFFWAALEKNSLDLQCSRQQAKVFACRSAIQDVIQRLNNCWYTCNLVVRLSFYRKFLLILTEMQHQRLVFIYIQIFYIFIYFTYCRSIHSLSVKIN